MLQRLEVDDINAFWRVYEVTNGMRGMRLASDLAESVIKFFSAAELIGLIDVEQHTIEADGHGDDDRSLCRWTGKPDDLQ